jgi:hypothetical protein
LRIEITLPKDRTLPGKLQAFDDGDLLILDGIGCLGKSDNATAKLHGNPDRITTRPFGDTPTGEYRVVQLVAHLHSESEIHTYGTFPSVLLDPLSGDALAAKQNGRTGLMIHGGVPGGGGRLRPTFGCIRIAENDERDLVALIVNSALALSRVRIGEA